MSKLLQPVIERFAQDGSLIVLVLLMAALGSVAFNVLQFRQRKKDGEALLAATQDSAKAVAIFGEVQRQLASEVSEIRQQLTELRIQIAGQGGS
jgi:uncharacterized protein HemX